MIYVNKNYTLIIILFILLNSFLKFDFKIGLIKKNSYKVIKKIAVLMR